jgi:hypothetical protein
MMLMGEGGDNRNQGVFPVKLSAKPLAAPG